MVFLVDLYNKDIKHQLINKNWKNKILFKLFTKLDWIIYKIENKIKNFLLVFFIRYYYDLLSKK